MKKIQIKKMVPFFISIDYVKKPEESCEITIIS